MDTIVLTTANSKTTEPHKYSYKLTNAMHLDDHFICLSNLSMYYTWKNIKASYGNNTLKYQIGDKSVDVIFPDGSYSIKDIDNYLHMTMRVNNDSENLIRIFSNVTYNRVSIVVGLNCKLVLGDGIAKVLGFSNPTIINQSHGDLVPMIERVDVVLVHCNLAQNNFTQDSSLIFSFVPDSAFGTQLHQKPSFPLWRQTRQNSEITEIDIWFTDQLYRPLEIEDNILVELNLTSHIFI
jgi:hypothetical protein